MFNKEENFTENLLAIDCASVTCSVAVYGQKRILCNIDTDVRKTHSVTLLPSIDAALKFTGLSVSDLSGICVTVGPGSFTGLKIGISTAKGLAFNDDIPCYAVSSMTALAYGYCGFDGIICASFDARRNMLYNALFLSQNGVMTRLCQDRQSSVSEAVAETIDLSGQYGLPAYFVGDGAALCSDSLNGFSAEIFTDGIKASSMISAVLAGDCVCIDAESLLPEYLRPSQAERERTEKGEHE